MLLIISALSQTSGLGMCRIGHYPLSEGSGHSRAAYQTSKTTCHGRTWAGGNPVSWAHIQDALRCYNVQYAALLFQQVNNLIHQQTGVLQSFISEMKDKSVTMFCITCMHDVNGGKVQSVSRTRCSPLALLKCWVLPPICAPFPVLTSLRCHRLNKHPSPFS